MITKISIIALNIQTTDALTLIYSLVARKMCALDLRSRSTKQIAHITIHVNHISNWSDWTWRKSTSNAQWTHESLGRATKNKNKMLQPSTRQISVRDADIRKANHFETKQSSVYTFRLRFLARCLFGSCVLSFVFGFIVTARATHIGFLME